MAESEPQLVILAGPNGAGKSTLAPELLAEFGIPNFINADVIARGLSAFDPESVAIEAGRLMLGRMKGLASERASFAFETTLASRSYATWLKDQKESGYRIHLHYVWVRSPELSNQRVAARVRRGGHFIPTDVVERRYSRSVRNFFELYRPVASSWKVYDNSSGSPVAIGEGSGHQESIHDAQRWNEFLACRR